MRLLGFIPPLFCLVILFLAGVVLVSDKTEALSECDLNMIYLNAEHYQPCATTAPVDSCSGSTASLSGSNNEEKIYNFLTGKGLSPEQASGIMGNLSVESGYTPNNQQNGSPWPTDGWGIAQWTNSAGTAPGEGRRDKLAKAVKDAGLPYVADKVDGGRNLTPEENDALLALELNFLYNESNARTMRDNPAKKEWDGLEEVKAVKDAVVYWEYNFERAGVPALGQRLEDANDVFARLGSSTGGTAGTATGGVNCTSTSGTIVSGWSLPVDRKWYDDHPDYFTKDHHDDPAADIPVPTGTPVYSMSAGTITRAPIFETDESYGQGVWIDAGNGVEIIYAHGSDGGSVPGAKKGDKVTPGQLIMHSASTGNSDGPHLHLEIRYNGKSVCPQSLFVGIVENKIPTIASLPSTGCTY